MAAETPQEDLPESIQLPAVWVAAEDQPILAANQFLAQFEKELFFLSVGQLTPPTILGTPRERYEQVKGMGFVPVKTVGRFSLTRGALDELISLLESIAKTYDEALKEG